MEPPRQRVYLLDITMLAGFTRPQAQQARLELFFVVGCSDMLLCLYPCIAGLRLTGVGKPTIGLNFCLL